MSQRCEIGGKGLVLEDFFVLFDGIGLWLILFFKQLKLFIALYELLKFVAFI